MSPSNTTQSGKKPPSSLLMICADSFAGCPSGNNSAGFELMLKRNSPAAPIREMTTNKAKIVLGFFVTQSAIKSNNLSNPIPLLLLGLLSALNRGLVLGSTELNAGIKNRLPIKASPIPILPRTPICPPGISTCPNIQSNPAMVVNPDKIMGAPRLVTILTDNSFAV